LLTINNGNAIKTIIKDFGNLGYNITYKLLKVSDFEVPQKRERVIIIGTRKDILPKFNFDKIKHKKAGNVYNAINDIANYDEGFIENHKWSKAKMNKGQGNSVIDKNDFAPTMRAEHHGNIEFHYDGKRRLSAREAARIQSFPDDFIFYPSTSSAYKQIGNAVPPVFAWHIASAIQQFLDDNL
jgi:DNA (cytosine-5)-methyltransferase 1